MSKRPRLFYLDLVRTLALICILIIHFNATVTGYFTLPHKLFTSTLPGGIYLVDFGSSLFFIVSGAALAYTAKEPFSTKAFYKRRAHAVYPMFWLAWCLCFSIRFVTQPGYYSAAKTPTLILTVLGLDNFAVAAGRGSHRLCLRGRVVSGQHPVFVSAVPAALRGDPQE